MGVGVTQDKLYKAILRAADDPEFGLDFAMTPFVAHSLTNLQFGAMPMTRRDGTEYQLEKGARLGDLRTKSRVHRYREIEFTVDFELKDIEKRLGVYSPPANKFELMECFGNWARTLAQLCGPIICYLMMLGLHRMMTKHLHDERRYTLLEMLDFIDIYQASWSRRLEECTADPERYKYTDEEHQMAEKYGFMRLPLMVAGEDDPTLYNNLTLPIQLEREDALNDAVTKLRRAKGQKGGANYRFISRKKPARDQWSGSQADEWQADEHDLLEQFIGAGDTSQHDSDSEHDSQDYEMAGAEGSVESLSEDDQSDDDTEVVGDAPPHHGRRPGGQRTGPPHQGHRRPGAPPGARGAQPGARQHGPRRPGAPSPSARGRPPLQKPSAARAASKLARRVPKQLGEDRYVLDIPGDIRQKCRSKIQRGDTPKAHMTRCPAKECHCGCACDKIKGHSCPFDHTSKTPFKWCVYTRLLALE